VIALATDSEAALPAPTGLPLFHLDDVDGVAAFILAQEQRCRYCRASERDTAQAMRAMSRIVVGPARRSISDSSGLFQPSMNIASATMNIGATTRPMTSSTKRASCLRTSGR
jgi:hypothetical protein